MAERRRIIPASVGPTFNDQREKKTAPAVRLHLDLGETTEESCPEFAYPVLVKNVLGEEIDDHGGKSFNDVHEEDLEGLEAIAKRFEEKYREQGKGGKKKRVRLEDLLDAGMGYDETDPFVDNSECYDELVPASLTTQFGGFYINSGQLKFKEISDSDDGDMQSKKNRTPKKKRKMKLENGDQKRERKVKRKLSGESGGGDHISKKTKKQLKKKFREDKKKKKRGPRMIRTLTVAEMLKRNAQGSPTSSPQAQQATPTSSSINGPPKAKQPSSTHTPAATSTPQGGGVTSSATPTGGAGGGTVDLSLDLGISMADLNMDKELMDVMASMNGSEGISARGGKPAGGVTSGGGMGGGDQDSDMNVSPSAPGAGGEEGGSKEIVNLPLGLPLQLVDNIQKIKEAARKSVEGKTKFFNSGVNGLLLRIEHGTRTLTCTKRSAVYAHLANHLPCSKLTLQKRAKKLQLGAQDSQLREPLQRLREAVAQVMPAQDRRYKTECEEASLKADLEPNRDVDGNLIEHKAPKKRFVWDDRLRKLLREVVNVKVKTYEISKSRTQSAEEYLKAFLEAEVKVIWPKDWIQTRNLFKESREVHDHVTSTAAKQRKGVPGGPRKLVMSSNKKGNVSEEGAGCSAPSQAPTTSAAPQEGEPSSTQISEIAGSPVTVKHLENMPTIFDGVGSGEDSMDMSISSSQNKGGNGGVGGSGREYVTASSDSNQDTSPVTGQSAAQEVPVSSTSPLPNLDPNFLVEQLIGQQLLDTMGLGMAPGGGAGGAVTSMSQNTLSRTGGDAGARVAGGQQATMVGKSRGGITKDAVGEGFPSQSGKQHAAKAPPSSYAAKLSAISNMHSMRTLHTQESGVQAKDVTSSGMMGGSKGKAPGMNIPVSQPVIKLMRDSKLEKLSSQGNSRVTVQSNQPKLAATSSVQSAPNIHSGLQMPYTQTSSSNTSLQGRSGITTHRTGVGVGGGMDALPHMSAQVTPGNGSISLSPSSSQPPQQATSRRASYASPTGLLQGQGAAGLHSHSRAGGSAFSTPSIHHAKPPQTSPSRPQQTSPSGMASVHGYSPNSSSSTHAQQYPTPHQQYSPGGHTSPIAAAYSTSSTSYQAMGATGGNTYQHQHQQQPIHRGSTGTYANNYPMAAATGAQSVGQGGVGVPQSPVDAVITGPAPGTYFHQTPTGGMFPTLQTTPPPSHPLPAEAIDLLCAHPGFADPRFVSDSSSSQHRIH